MIYLCKPNRVTRTCLGGQPLADILKDNPQYLGSYGQLPILLKLLDASERLVIQAYSNAENAKTSVCS